MLFASACSSSSTSSEQQTSPASTTIAVAEDLNAEVDDHDEDVVVITRAEPAVGPVEGAENEDGMVVFLGIPFAKPPIDELRFKPPVASEAWTAVLVADSFGDSCVQSAGPESWYANNSEDCLNLNVWTPAVGEELRPVMVWVHGGGWIAEGTAGALYHGDLLAARGDVVVVTVEYRMGIFGFPYLDGLEGGEAFAGSGNLGLLDQQLALKWVRDNIAAFGGDPESVTLFGESAGGMSAISHLTMPSSDGLFHRAIAQSGAGNTVRSSEFGATIARQHLDLAGVSTPDEFAALSTEEIFATQESMQESAFPVDLVYGPVQDGVILPEFPHHAIAAGAGSDIALLHGTTRHETTLYNTLLPILADLSIPDVAGFVPYLNSAIPEGMTSQEVADFYASSRSDEPESLLLHAFGTDAFFRMGAIRVSEARDATDAETYMYRFDWEPPMPAHPPGEYGSPHAAELAFVLGHPDGWPTFYGETVPQGLMDQMMDAWANFARTGDPNGEGVPAWPTYELENRSTMLFSSGESAATSIVSDDPDGSEREFWAEVPFDGVTPAQG